MAKESKKNILILCACKEESEFILDWFKRERTVCEENLLVLNLFDGVPELAHGWDHRSKKPLAEIRKLTAEHNVGEIIIITHAGCDSFPMSSVTGKIDESIGQKMNTAINRVKKEFPEIRIFGYLLKIIPAEVHIHSLHPPLQLTPAVADVS